MFERKGATFDHQNKNVLIKFPRVCIPDAVLTCFLDMALCMFETTNQLK
jgi:hypothetical protein